METPNSFVTESGIKVTSSKVNSEDFAKKPVSQPTAPLVAPAAPVAVTPPISSLPVAEIPPVEKPADSAPDIMPQTEIQTNLDRINELRKSHGLSPLTDTTKPEQVKEAVEAVKGAEDAEDELEFDENKPVDKKSSKEKWAKLSGANKSKKQRIAELETELQTKQERLAQIEENELKELEKLRTDSMKSKTILDKIEFVESEEYQALYARPMESIETEVGQYMEAFKVSGETLSKIVGAKTLKEKEMLLSEHFKEPSAAARVGQLMSEYADIQKARKEADESPYMAQETLREEIRRKKAAELAKNKVKIDGYKVAALANAVDNYAKWEPTSEVFKTNRDAVAEQAKKIFDFVSKDPDPTNPKWMDYLAKLCVSASCTPTVGAQNIAAANMIKGLEDTIRDLTGGSSNGSRGRSVRTATVQKAAPDLSKMTPEERRVFLHTPHA